MKVIDLVRATPLERTVQLAQVAAVRARLAQEGDQLTDAGRAALSPIVAQYIPDGGGNDAALRAMLECLARPERHGGAFYLWGLAGTGKSHLLGLLALLTESRAARELFAESHPPFADLCGRFPPSPPLVVMADLAAHRAQQDQLEDVIFACTEEELRRPGHGTDVPLTELSHALSLIDRHLVPGHRADLDSAVDQQAPGFENWEHLRAENPAGAVRIARRVVRDVGFPLDFRQSRVERLASLLEVVRKLNLRGVLWLIDGLSSFLAGAGPRGMAVDWDFLHFIAQRAKITPLWMTIALRHSPQTLAETDPYSAGQLESYAEGAFGLSNAHMREVVARRVVQRIDPQAFEDAIAEIQAAHAGRMPVPPFTAPELASTYPLHPLTHRCVASIATRLFSDVGSLPAFAHAVVAGDAARGIPSGDERPYDRLVSPVEAYDYLQPHLANHPDVSVYVYDVVDFHTKNAATLAPGKESLCLAATKTLTLCRLANLAPTVAELADALFPPAELPELPLVELQSVLEKMRLKGQHIEVRRQHGEGADLYRADARTTFADAVRRRLAGMKATIDDDDARLRDYLTSVASDPSLPLSQLAEETASQEAEWHNTTRYASLQAANIAALQASDLTEAANVLSDPATLEDCLVYVADVVRADVQQQRWLALTGGLADARWVAGLIAWIPRTLGDQELDALKAGLACRLLLAEPALAGSPEAAGLRRRLEEERAALDQEVRSVVTAAYYEGEVLNNRGVALSAGELQPLRGDWTATVSAMAAHAFNRLFPAFTPIAPTRKLESPEQVDALVAEFISPGEAPVDPGTPLDALIASLARPLGIATLEKDRYVLRADGPAVRAVMDALRRRDRTPEHETGPPFECAELALHMVKSELGLPGELFELVTATLLRTGYLVAIDGNGITQPWQKLRTPVRDSVARVARAPLLRWPEWQEVGRLARSVLGVGVVKPDRATQESLWRNFVRAGDLYARRSAALKAQLQELAARLGHGGQQWDETRQALASLDQFFNCFDDNLPAAAGFKEVLAQTAPYLKATAGRVRLRVLLDFAHELDDFLQGPAKELIALHGYLHDPGLSIDNHSELVRVRDRILSYLQSGEELLRDGTALRRTAQAFMAAYRRAYLAWHAAQYRPALFEPYAAFRQSVEYAAVNRLSRLAVNVEVDRSAIDAMIDDQVAQQCTASGVAEALNERPVCPRCTLRLDDEVRLVKVERIREAAADAIRGYVTELKTPETAAAIRAYAASLPKTTEVREAVQHVLAVPPKIRAREVLAIFSDDVIAHLNRALGGQSVHYRRLHDLSAKLVDRTLTRAETVRIVEGWIDGDEDLNGEDLVVVDR